MASKQNHSMNINSRHQQLPHPMLFINSNFLQEQNSQSNMNHGSMSVPFPSLPMFNQLPNAYASSSSSNLMFPINSLSISGAQPAMRPIIFSQNYLLPNSLSFQQPQIPLQWKIDSLSPLVSMRVPPMKSDDQVPVTSTTSDCPKTFNFKEKNEKENTTFSNDIESSSADQQHSQSVPNSSPVASTSHHLLSHEKQRLPSNRIIGGSIAKDESNSSSPANIDGNKIDEVEYRTVCDRCTKMKVRCEKQEFFDSCTRCLKKGKGCVYSRKRTRKEMQSKGKSLRKVKGQERSLA